MSSSSRINGKHSQAVRDRIKVAKLVSMLEHVALTGKDEAGQIVSPARLRAAETLLAKTLPNLQQQDITQHNTGETYLVQVPADVSDPETWEKSAKKLSPQLKDRH